MRIIIKIIKYSAHFFFIPLYWLSWLIPKNKKLWIFGAWFGRRFSDNAKYLFQYVLDNHPEIRAIWLSRSREVIEIIRKHGHEAYMANSFKGILFSCRASCIVVCQGLVDVNRYAIGRAKKVQLWHGTPLKKIGSDDFLHNVKKRGSLMIFLRKIRDIILPFLVDRFSFVIATSVEAGANLATAFEVPESRIRVTGYPRNDVLLGNCSIYSEVDLWRKKNERYLANRKIIGYLPTFRDNRSIDLFADYGFAEREVRGFLENHQAVFWTKAHFMDKSAGPLVEIDSSTIFFLPDENYSDIYPLLKLTDILIIDYSSVYFDFLLLCRPIIFAPFDIEDYMNKSRKLYYDYDTVTPGPKAKNWQEVLNLIDKILKKDKWEKAREEVCNRFNKFRDGNSSSRVFKEIMRILES